MKSDAVFQYYSRAASICQLRCGQEVYPFSNAWDIVSPVDTGLFAFQFDLDVSHTFGLDLLAVGNGWH